MSNADSARPDIVRHRVSDVEAKIVQRVAWWTDEDTGYACEILCISLELSPPELARRLDWVLKPWLCGYVTVPKGHPLYSVSDADLDLEVHGGVTDADGEGCFGFDQHHGWDEGVQMDETHCRAECRRLANSLKRLEKQG